MDLHVAGYRDVNNSYHICSNRKGGDFFFSLLNGHLQNLEVTAPHKCFPWNCLCATTHRTLPFPSRACHILM